MALSVTSTRDQFPLGDTLELQRKRWKMGPAGIALEYQTRPLDWGVITSNSHKSWMENNSCYRLFAAFQLHWRALSLTSLAPRYRVDSSIKPVRAEFIINEYSVRLRSCAHYAPSRDDTECFIFGTLHDICIASNAEYSTRGPTRFMKYTVRNRVCECIFK